MVVSIRFESETGDYVSGVDDAIKALKDWESQTGVSALNATDKFEEAIEAVIYLGRATNRTRDEMKDALRGIGLSAEDAEDALRAVEEQTDDIGRDGPRDLEKLGDAADDTEQKLGDMGDSAAQAADKTGQISDKAGTVGDGLRSLGDIAKDVLEGDFGSATSGALDALGGLAGAAGVGGAVGAAVTSAISGLVNSAVTELQRLVTAAETARKDVVNEMVELGGELDEAAIHRRMNEIVQDDEKLANLKILQEATGISDASLLRAMAGDSELAAEAVKRLREVAESGAIPDSLVLAANKAATEIGGIALASEDAAPRIDLVNRAVAEGRDKAADAALAYFAYVSAVGKATGETDALGNAILEMPDGKKVVVDAETQTASSDLDAFEKRRLPTMKQLVKAVLDDSAVKNYRPSPITIGVRVKPTGPFGRSLG